MFTDWPCQLHRPSGSVFRGDKRGMVRRPRKVIEGLRCAMAREILEAFIVRVWVCWLAVGVGR